MKNHFNHTRAYAFVFLLFTSINVVQAQKFGKIDNTRLQELSHPMDPDASHAYILKNCYIHYDLNSRFPRIISEYHYRIKIYKDDGVDQANIVKYIYRNKRDREVIKNVKAECYNFVDGKSEKSKLSKDDIFKEEIDENTTKVSFAIPNARAGSIIEFKYKISSPFVYSFPRHYFQTDVPVDFSELKVDIPNYFTMSPTATGLLQLNRNEDQIGSGGRQETQFTFDVSDVPGIEDDKYVLDINDYRSSIKYELSQVDYPGQEAQIFTKDWNSICENLLESNLFGDAMNDKVKPAKNFLNEISELSEEEKLYKIVDFINTNITWNGNVGKYGSSSYKKLFESKKGDVADINLLLINLCRKAGLKSYPVLTKSRFGGILNTSFPSLTEINYVFAMVMVDGKEYFVDASSPYFEPGTLPLRALNIEGILMLDDRNQAIALKNTNLNYNKRAGKYTFDLEERKLIGKGKYTLKGYAAVKARRKLKEEDDDEDLQDLMKEDDEQGEDEDGDDENEEEEDQEDVYHYADSEGFDNKYGNISSNFEAQLYSPIEQIGNEIYLDAFVTLEFDENPFLNEKREYPAFFNSKHHVNHVSILDIPEGYKLKSKPDNLSLKMPSGKGILTYVTNVSTEKITVNTLFKINDDIFLPEEYTTLNEFFNLVLQKQKEKIVFVKE